MILSPNFLNSKAIRMPLQTTPKSTGLKGSVISKKLSNLIKERKDYYSGLSATRYISPRKIFDLETIRSNLSKVKIKKNRSSKPAKELKLKKLNRSLKSSLLEIKPQSGVIYSGTMKSAKQDR